MRVIEYRVNRKKLIERTLERLIKLRDEKFPKGHGIFGGENISRFIRLEQRIERLRRLL